MDCISNSHKQYFPHLKLNKEENIIASHFVELSRKASTVFFPIFTNFLDIREKNIAECAANLSGCNFKFFGGFDDAQREICCFFNKEIEVTNQDYPIDNLNIVWNKSYKISHRDVLGAIMSKQIDRMFVGDVLLQDGYAITFIDKKFSNYFCNEINKIANVGVSCSIVDDFILPKVLKKEEIYLVTSFRIDCIVSSLCNISRSNSSKLISSGKVFCDGRLIENISEEIKSNQIISIRGIGKFQIFEILGNTKSGKFRIKTYRFI